MSGEDTPVTQDNKIRAAWVGLGFTALVHTILVAAFISRLASGQDANTSAIKDIQREQHARARGYYAVEHLERRLSQLQNDIRDIKKILSRK